MSYYDDKKRALDKITSMYEEGKPFNEILLYVENKFGFSKKIVQDRIKLIESFRNNKNVD